MKKQKPAQKGVRGFNSLGIFSQNQLGRLV